MKDKFGLTKIENPYKTFFKNIQIGLILILLIFGSIFAGNLFFNKFDDVSAKTETTYKTVYYYYLKTKYEEKDRGLTTYGYLKIFIEYGGYYLGRFEEGVQYSAKSYKPNDSTKSYNVLGVFTSNQFTPRGILGVPSAGGVDVSKYSRFYILLDALPEATKWEDDKGKGEGKWVYELPDISFTAAYKLGNDSDAYSATNLMSLKKTTCKLRIGEPLKLEYTDWLNGLGNSYIANATKKVVINETAFDASKLYFFMDINKDLWAWDGTNYTYINCRLSSKNKTKFVLAGWNANLFANDRTINAQIVADFGSNTFEITSENDLACAAELVNTGFLDKVGNNYTFKLMKDIGSNKNAGYSSSSYSRETGYTCIGATSGTNSPYWIQSFYKGHYCFKGTFDGNGKTIQNIYCSLFESVDGATIKNLKITNLSLLPNSQMTFSYTEANADIGFVSGLVVWAKGNTKISGIEVKTCSIQYGSSVTGRVDHLMVGGLVARMEGGMVSECKIESFNAKITPSSCKNGFAEANVYIGAIVGVLNLSAPTSDINIYKCHVPSFTCDSYYDVQFGAGGIVGFSYNGKISECSVGNSNTIFFKAEATSSPTSYNIQVGGIAGRIFGTIISNCANKASIMEIDPSYNFGYTYSGKIISIQAGGIVGQIFSYGMALFSSDQKNDNYYAGSSINGCYNVADINAKCDAKIENKSSETVSCVALIGGIVGQIYTYTKKKTFTISKCFSQSYVLITNHTGNETANKICHTVGGIVGQWGGTNSSYKSSHVGTLNIENCYAIIGMDNWGNSAGIDYGRILGYNQSTIKPINLTNCYYSNNITSTGMNVGTAASQIAPDSAINNSERVEYLSVDNKDKIKSFVTGVNENAEEIIFGFNSYYQDGLPFLVNVGNKTTELHIYQNDGTLKNYDYVYKPNNESYYLGFLLEKAVVYNDRRLWTDGKTVVAETQKTKISDVQFKLYSASKSSMEFAGYAVGDEKKKVSTNPNLQYTEFPSEYKNIYTTDFSSSQIENSDSQTENNVITLTAIFVKTYTIYSNLNLISGKDSDTIGTEPTENSSIRYNTADHDFVLKYTKKNNDIYIYTFTDYISEAVPTYANLSATLYENEIIDNEGIFCDKFNLGVFSDKLSFKFDAEPKALAELASNKIESGKCIYAYTAVNLYVIGPELDKENGDELIGWKYAEDSTTGYLVYGRQVTISEYEYDKGVIEDYEDYEISRKGFVLEYKPNLFGGKDENSTKNTYTLNSIPSSTNLYAVYNSGPSITINYNYANREKKSELLAYAEKTTNGDSTTYTFKLTNSKYINCEDYNFAGWWADETFSDDDNVEREYRVNASTIFTSSISQPTINLHEKVITKETIDPDNTSPDDTTITANVEISVPSQSDGYYIVSTPEELIWISYKVNNGAKEIKFKLNNDIDLSGYNFYPISADYKNVFSGIFCGQGYSIKNLTLQNNTLLTSCSISGSDNEYEYDLDYSECLGLFAYSCGTIQHVNILSASISHQVACTTIIGTVVGNNTGVISNVVVDSKIEDTTNSTHSVTIGGIAGKNSGKDSVEESGIIQECVAKTNLIIVNQNSPSSKKIGLIVGSNEKDVTDSFAIPAENGTSDLIGSGNSTRCYLYNDNDNDIPNLSSLNKNIWAQANYINGGKPYLKNTGITKINFVNSMPNNAFNGKNNILGKDESDKEDTITKDFFILDNYASVYEKVLQELFKDYSYSGFNFAGYTKEEGNSTYLKTTRSTYTDDEKDNNGKDKIDVFKNGTYYYSVWTPNTFNLSASYGKKTKELGPYQFGADLTNKEGGFSSIFEKISSEFKQDDKEIDYLEFSFGGQKFYVFGNGNFVKVENERITSATLHYGIKNFFPYMYNQNITLIPHFYDITYKVYFDLNGGEWNNLPSGANIINGIVYTTGKGSDQVQVGNLSLAALMSSYEVQIGDNTLLRDGIYIQKIGYHPVGFTYSNANNNVSIKGNKQFNELTNYNRSNNSTDPEDIYNEEIALTLSAIYEPNVYKVNYIAKNNIETESFAEGFDTNLGTQWFTYNDESASIFNGQVPGIKNFKFVEYALVYNDVIYYIDEEGNFIYNNNDTKLKINGNIIEKFTPYLFTEDLTIYCIFERQKIGIEISGIEGVIIYYETIDHFTNETTEHGIAESNIDVKYGDTFKFKYYLIHGAKLNYIKINNEYVFNVENKTYQFTSYASEFSKQSFQISSIIENQYIEFNCDTLNTGSLESKDDVYLIYDAEDLYTFFEKYNSSKGKLMNNINLAGYKFSVEKFSGELDGNSFTISGFVLSNDLNDNFGFVQNLTGTLKNVNFDNVIFNINSYLLDIDIDFISSTAVTIEAINLAVVAANNRGTIENVYVLGGKFNITNNIVDDGVINVGIIAVNNYGTISGSCAEISIDIVNKIETNKSRTLTFAGIATKNNGVVEKSYFDGTINCNAGNVKGLVVENNGTLSACYAYYNNSEVEIIEKENDENNSTFITIGNTKRLANVNNTIVKLSHNYTENTNTTELTTYLSGNKIIDSEYYYYLYKLNNRVTFNQITNIQEVSYKFNISMKIENSNVSNNFTTKVNSTEELDDSKSVSYIIKNYPEYILYDFVSSPKVWDALELKFTISSESEFTETNIVEILESSSMFVTINGITTEQTITSDLFDKNGQDYTLSMQKILKINYNDEVKVMLELPAWARLGIDLGAKVNGKELATYRSSRNFSYEFFAGRRTAGEKIQLFVERNILNLKIYLNKNDLLDSEKSYINFNSDLYTNNEDYLYNATEESLTIILHPTKQGADYSYVAPDISNLFSYDKLGINYAFNGLYEKENEEFSNIVFDANGECQISFDRDYEVFVKWEAVKYTIVMTYDETIRYSSYNGFSQTSGYMIKSFKFGKKLTDDEGISTEIPYASKLNYNYAYKFEGLNISNSDSIVYALTMNEENEPVLFDEYFSREWTNFQNGAINGLPKITLTPIFTEIEFEVKVKAEGTIVTENGEISTLGGKFENNKQSFDIKITISDYSQMKENNFSNISVPIFEHFDFVGYYNDNPSSLILNYSSANNCYNEKECEELLSNTTLFAKYNSTFVDVTIHGLDAYSQEQISFNIVKTNDITEYEFVNNNLVFKVEYNSTNVELPQIEIQSQNYQFANYVVNNSIYTQNFVFDANIDIYLDCNYKVIIKTYGANIQSDEFVAEIENQIYSCYKTSPLFALSKVTLPTLELGSYTLQGYKVNTKTNLYAQGDEVDVNEPLIIEAIWTGNIVTISLDGNGSELPSSISNFEGLMGYTLVDSTHAKISVVHGTLGSALAEVLPTLSQIGKTFDKYLVEETTELRNFVFDYDENQNVNVKADFIDKNYIIQIIENNNVVEEIEANYNETITSTFTPSLSGLTYCGLSLNENYLNLFEMPEKMPYLEEVCLDNIDIIGNDVILKLYAFYLSNVVVRIEQNNNAKITNTTGLLEFTGGNSFGNPASFKLSVENILNLNFALPVPEVRNELIFATFIGYYGYNEKNEFVPMTDENGNLTNEFKIKENIVLSLVFEQGGYNLILNSDYSIVISKGDFEQSGAQFIKYVEFNELVGELPVLQLSNYQFKGFYFSNNSNNILVSSDIQLSDENGSLVTGFEKFSMDYINKLAESGVSIVAKYVQAIVTINVASSNSSLGNILVPRNEQGTAFEFTQTESGYSCNVPSGTSIILTAIEANGAKFVEWTQDKTFNIVNASEKETMILKVTDDVTIIANFDYVNYKISYYLEDEELTDITPSSFHMDQTIILPDADIEGFDFLGWYEEKSLTTPISQINNGTCRDIKVYAKVKNKEIYANIYSSLDNYGSAVSYKVYYNLQLSELTNYNVTEDGFTLIGFFTEKNGNGVAINENSLCTFKNDFNLYAWFESGLENHLKGNGTQTNPYKISSESDLNNFANLINANLYNSDTTYYELTTNLTITSSNLITIGNGVKTGFNAKFNGGNNVIYIKGENFNSTFILSENGNINAYNALFGISNGEISNLVIVSDITLNQVYGENYSQIVGNVCAINNGTISNCIVYAKLVDNTSNSVTSGVVSAINNKEEKLNTSIKVVNNEVQILTKNDSHYHKNNVTKPSINKNSYYIYSDTDLAWLTTQSKVDYDVYLMNNLDMKGKIIGQIKLNSNFYGNGYTISNLLIIDGTSLFKTITQNHLISKVYFENVAMFNFTTNVSLIEQNNGSIEETLVSGITSGSLLVNENNSVINNVYSVSDNICYYVVNVNNGSIENSYAYINSFIKTNLGTTNCVYDVTNENYNEKVGLIEANFDINTNSSIWITDVNCVMFAKKLPVLKGVGNIYLSITAPDEFSVSSATPFNPINNILLLKKAEDLEINFKLSETYLRIGSLLLNNINIINNKVGSKIYINKSYLSVENELIVELEKSNVRINISVENSTFGDIRYNGSLYKTYTFDVEYGTTITFDAVANTGYRFLKWSDNITTSSREITASENLNLVALFVKVYILEVHYNANDVTCVSKHDNFTETDYGLIGTFDTTEFETLENLYPVLSKQNYVLTNFSITRLSDNITIRIIADWEIDYVNATISADARNYSLSITSNDNVEGVNVIENLTSRSYNILRNANATFTLNLTSSYLTQLLINGIDIYSAEDYENFKTSSAPIIVDLTSYTNSDIQIVFSANDIEYNVYFATSSEYDISFKRMLEVGEDKENANIYLRNYVTLLQGEEVKFSLIFDNNSMLDKIRLLSIDGDELATEILITNEFNQIYYSFIPTENTIIDVVTKIREFTIKINYTEGGRVTTNCESEMLENNVLTFTLKYNESFELYTEIDNGYKLSDVVRKIGTQQTSLSLSNSYTISNVNSDMEINFTFIKQLTWLSVDGDNKPINFTLTQIKGSGTQQKPYLISNIRDFLTIAYNVNILNESYADKVFKVESKDLTFDFSQYNFMPIGTITTSFNGTILGNNLTLKGIKIENGTSVGVFNELGANALIKSINISGTIKAHNMVASLVGTNNGTILGCSSNATILGINENANEKNIVAGLCAINNGTISQSSFSGSISGSANVMAGLCGINNGQILNVFNTAKVELTKNNSAENIYVSGLVGKNTATLKFGYNASKVKATGENIILNAVASNTGTISDVYYNSSVLTAEENIGLTSSALKDEKNPIYQTWDFESIWYFNQQTYDFPKLQTLYEFSATINFKVNFDNTIATKVLFVTLTNAYGESFDFVLNASRLSVSISDLPEGVYTITLKTTYNVSINSETTATLELNETNGKIYPVEISLIKTANSGYCSSILL